MSNIRARVFAFSFVVSTTFVACGSGDSGPSVGKQCETFTDTHAAGMKKIEAVDGDDPAKEAAESATLFDGLAGDIEKLGIKDAELKKLSDEYVAMLKAAANTQRSLSKIAKKASGATSAKAMKGAEKELDDLDKQIDKYVKDEDALVDKINDYCKDKL